MKRWPHAPSHQVDHPGAYFVTASTLHKQRLFNTPQKLDLLEGSLLETLEEFGWRVQAWAVFANHYHYVALSPEDSGEVMKLTRKLHANTARDLNRIDEVIGRKVWFQAWDVRISYANSYLARLAYVHHNAVRHRLVAKAELYPWCSASWFFQNADRAWYETVTSFPIERIHVEDDYD